MSEQFTRSNKVLDNHCHICFAQNIEESLSDYEKLFSELSISEAGLLSCPDADHCENGFDPTENIKVLYLKSRLSIPVYAYASFTWHFDEPAPYGDFAKEMLKMGFDGFKSLTQHPRSRKNLGKGLSHPSFAGFFKVLDESGSTIVCHVGDPKSSWDISTASKSAIELGRVYGEGFLSLEELYGEMERVYKTYRNVNFILAHFYFMSGDINRVEKLLWDNSNVYLDLTPGGEMYVNFTKDPVKWREFFIKHQDRIILGSDNYAKGYGKGRYALARNFLEGSEPFPYSGGGEIIPISLPNDALKNICSGNVKRLIGNTPKEIDRKAAYEHCLFIKENLFDKLSPIQRENLDIITRHFK